MLSSINILLSRISIGIHKATTLSLLECIFWSSTLLLPKISTFSWRGREKFFFRFWKKLLIFHSGMKLFRSTSAAVLRNDMNLNFRLVWTCIYWFFIRLCNFFVKDCYSFSWLRWVKTARKLRRVSEGNIYICIFAVFFGILDRLYIWIFMIFVGDGFRR